MKPPPLSYRMMQAAMGRPLKLLGMSCQEIHRLSAEKLDRKLTRGESLRLRLHLMMCGICRRLPTQFRLLRALVRRALSHEHPEDSDVCLPEETKARIAGRLESESHPA